VESESTAAVGCASGNEEGALRLAIAANIEGSLLALTALGFSPEDVCQANEVVEKYSSEQ
jgi:hypothetical protein